MEEKTLLEKEYSYDAETLREGIKIYQKKYVYPMAYVRFGIFILLSLNFAYGIATGPMNGSAGFFAVMFFVVCLALAFREIYNPLKIRRSISDSFAAAGSGSVYKISVREKEVEFSTVSEIVCDDENEEAEDSDIPEECIFPRDGSISILENDKLFVAAFAKTVYYIVPKKDFSEDELEIIRKL